MAEKKKTGDGINTRSAKRYASGGVVTMTIVPMGHDTEVEVVLLDLNKFGGLGIHIPLPGPLGSIRAATFLDRWKVKRSSRKGPIDFGVRLFNIVPYAHGGKPGLRASASPARQNATDDAGHFFISSRRRARRQSRGNAPVKLTSGGTKIEGRLLNVGDDDGIGIALEPATLGAITWKQIFLDDWRILLPNGPLPCVFQRLGIQKETAVLGAVAPGIAAAIQAARAGGSAAATAPPADDEDLLQLLNEVLKKKL
jgi:hypothetical protein